MASSWECDVDGIPEPPVWNQYAKHLKMPTRLLLIAYPCCGVVGSQDVTKALLHQACNVFDLDESYRLALEQIFKNCPELPTLHLGTDAGNVLSAALQNLTCPDAIVSGPPCPPWAGHGKKKSILDDRSLVYTAILKWTCHFIKAGCLQFAVVENVMGILKQWNGFQSFMDCVLQSLRKECPEFAWVVDTLHAEEYKLPQERNRVFLRGMRRTTASLPAVLAPFGEAKLADFLNLQLPSTRRDRIPEGKRRNLFQIELDLQVRLKNNPQEFPAGCVACAAIDRAEGKAFPQRITIDKTCTLTTANRFLFVFSVHDMHLPDKDRKVFRWLHPAERFGLQGLTPKLAKLIPFEKLVKASGNMYPVPFMTAVLSPMLAAIADSQPGTSLGKTVPPSMVASRFTVKKRKSCGRISKPKKKKPREQDDE